MCDVAPLFRWLRRALAVVAGLVVAVLAIAPGTVGATAAGATAAGATAVDDCGVLAERMERNEDIPPGLLHAVALAESGRSDPARRGSHAWPWTVRSGPDSFYLQTKELALSKVRDLLAAGRSNIDVGCMQINLGYHGSAFRSLDDAFDPAINVAYGARFLRELRQETRSWAKAAGRYHSADPDRNQAYRARVYRLWRDLRRRQGRDAPMITEALFVGDRLARPAGSALSARPEDSPMARVLTPLPAGQRRSADSAGIAVLRGR
jgi:soluble lytic murein transglycosylase-like protein